MNLKDEFKLILEFEKKNRNMFLKGKPFSASKAKDFKYGNKAHEKLLEEKFINGRKEKKPKKSNIVPDAAVYEYIIAKHSINDIETVRKYHNIAMDAENKMGHLLEEYIYQNIKNSGWIWCSGDILRAIDFIKKDENNKKDPWRALQIKSSDNSENSSSNKVRKNTKIKIEKWFRRFSQRTETNWPKLVDLTECEELSNDGFLKFIQEKAKS